MTNNNKIKLTSFSSGAGWACKLSPDTLSQVLRTINQDLNNEQAYGFESMDDCCIYTLENGEKIYKKCGTCHNPQKDSKSKVGPNLWNVIGRTAGSVSDYKYSNAMVAYAKEWSFEEMNSYLIKPQAYIKGTKMAFAGLRKEKDRASVILYMNSKGDNPKPLP